VITAVTCAPAAAVDAYLLDTFIFVPLPVMLKVYETAARTMKLTAHEVLRFGSVIVGVVPVGRTLIFPQSPTTTS
jgi:hypothetical protein